MKVIIALLLIFSILGAICTLYMEFKDHRHPPIIGIIAVGGVGAIMGMGLGIVLIMFVLGVSYVVQP